MPATAGLGCECCRGLTAGRCCEQVLALVDPAHSVNWFVGEWIPKAEEAAYKLADPGFRDAPNPPDGLKERSKKQSWTPWYTSPAPTPQPTPPRTPEIYTEPAPAPAPYRVPGDGVAPVDPAGIDEVERQRRMEKNVSDLEVREPENF